MSLGKTVIITNLKYGATTLATPAPVTVRPATGSSGTMRAQLDNYLMEVTTADKVTCTNLIS